MFEINNYQIHDKIYEGCNSIIYRGVQLNVGNRPVIIKVPISNSKHGADKLRHEWEMRKQVNSKYVVQYYALEPNPTYGFMLIEEDEQAEALANFIPGIGFEIPTFLDIALQLAEGLYDIHRSNIVHNDIKPSNLIFKPNIGKVKYIDFGSASPLHQVKQVLANPSVSGGTLIYLSPEQTGRTNRQLDYRTDFYSLGVTLYQLICGQLPFEAKNIMQLVHGHIAKKPKMPHEIKPMIPKPLSEIIMKLLNKDADDRYQSALGLFLDLKKCSEELKTKSEIAPFILAQKDLPECFYIPQKLYGRESELALMKQAFDRIASQYSKPEVIMVTGPVGSGKSALVNEIQPIIAANKGYFLSGRFERTNLAMAYSAIFQAFQAWVKQILLECREEEILVWRDQLLAALGNNGQMLIDFIPLLERIIGKQPPVPTLDVEQSKNRFHLVFQNLISVIAQPQHPLVLFLDDWQRADLASLNLIESCIANPTAQNVLLIGAYRDNEVNASHPVSLALDTIQKNGVAIRSIYLSALNLSSVNQLLSEALHNSSEQTYALAALLHKKTEGSPFYLRLFLQSLYAHQLLKYGGDGWEWDLQSIRQVPATDNVIDFMAHRIQELPEKVRAVLKVASCFGHCFKLDILQQVIKASVRPLAELQKLIDSGFIVQIEDDYQFIHDHFQETAYKLISSEERAMLHLSIGRLLQAKLPIEPSSEQLFEVVKHLNQGEKHITDQSERLMIATLNFKSGKKAKHSTAYYEALSLLQISKRFLDTLNSWKEHYTFAYDLHRELAELEYLNGNFGQAEALIELLFSQAQSVLNQGEIYSLLIVQRTMAGQYQKSIKLGYKALKLLGITLPIENLQKAFEDGQKLISGHLERLAIKNLDALLDMPSVNIPEKQLALKILDSIIPATYCTNSELHPVIITIMINFSLIYGYAPETSSAYSLYAQILCSKLNDYKMGYAFGQLAMKLSDKLNDPLSKCRACSLFIPFTLHWNKHLSEADSNLEAGNKAGLASGDFLHLGYLSSTKARVLFHRGESLNQLSTELISLLQFPSKTRNQVAIQQIRCMQIITTNLISIPSKSENITDFSFEGMTESEYQQNWQQQQDFLTLSHYAILKAYVFYLYNYLELAREAILHAKKLLSFSRGEFETVIYNFIDSLILTALYSAHNNELQQQYAKQLENNQKQMKIWADNCPENFQHKYLLVAAEIERIQGKDWEAAAHYEQAINAAKQQGFIQDQALACELGAKFWMGKQNSHCAQAYLHDAYNSYSRWGAKRKILLLTNQYPAMLVSPYGSQLSSFPISSDTTIKPSSLALIDLTSVLKASQTISSEIELPKLLFHMMQMLIENAGAQTGSFWLEEDNQLWLQTEYTSEGQVQTLQKLPLAQWGQGPRLLIDFVKRTHQTVLLGDAKHDQQFSKDPYISSHDIKSVLCIPLIRQKQLKGVLYLENNLLPHAFTEQHQQILTMLGSQIAISLENALLYESMRLISERYNLTLQSGNVGTWSWNIRTNEVSWGENMYPLFGVKKEEFAHTIDSVMAIIHPEDRKNVEQALKRTLTDNVPYNLEYRIIKPIDNSVRVMMGQGKIYRNDKGHIESIIGISWDITERKRLEEERIAALKQAEEKERQRAQEAERHRKEQEELTDTVYHEIRNPLSGIYGCIDDQKEIITELENYLSQNPNEKVKTFLNRVDKNIHTIELCAKHQKNIIESSLSLSKLEAGKTTLTYKPFQPHALINEIREIFASQIARKNLKVEISPLEQAITVRGDVDKFKSIVMNLLSNAVKYTNSSTNNPGCIKINLQERVVTPTQCDLILCVQDTGKGISSQQQSVLFQRFARPLSSQFTESVGLGLYITKKIIDSLGGTIEVESEEGKGSKFTVHLSYEVVTLDTRLKQDNQQKQLTPITPVQSAIKRNVLVVEDNLVNQKLLKRVVEQGNHNCMVANNGAEALEKCEQHKFDIIFMDLEMPVMSGLAATKKIREKEEQLDMAKIPIIGLSAYARENYIDEAQKVGMNAYITKPFEKKEIYEAINQWATANIAKPSSPRQVLATSAVMSTPEKSHISSPSFFQQKGPAERQESSVETFVESKSKQGLG